jgi:hypothetical protein
MKKQNPKNTKSKHIHKFLLVILILLAVQACENSNDNTIVNSKSGGSVSYSGCKGNNLKSTFSENQKPCITIQTIDSNYLKIQHVNAVFNCVFDSITIDCSIENNIIHVKENHINPNAYCTCEYDIEYKIGPLEYEKTYNIGFKDESQNNDEISFEFEFTDNTLKTVCIE